MTKEKAKSGIIPDGVTLGDNVMVMPSLWGGLFTHAGWTSNEHCRPEQYSWVTRGDVIATLYVSRPKIGVTLIDFFVGHTISSVNILSPASGLVLFTKYQANTTVELVKNSNHSGNFSLLLPDDEPKPYDGSWMFNDAVELLRANKNLLMKDSRFWSMQAKTSEFIDEYLAKQLAAECVIVPAMPRYKDYFDEARTRFPIIRPHLKHLINQVNE